MIHLYFSFVTGLTGHLRKGDATMADKIKVGLLTHAGGAHVVAYMNALAATEACAEVVLADPDGKWAEDAKNIPGPSS